jgi:hypothetical protein
VLLEKLAQPAHELHEPRLARLDGLEVFQHPLDCLVLARVVLDGLFAVGDVVAHGRVDVHLLGHRVADELGRHGVDHVAACLRIGGLDDLSQKRPDLIVSAVSSSITSLVVSVGSVISPPWSRRTAPAGGYPGIRRPTLPRVPDPAAPLDLTAGA